MANDIGALIAFAVGIVALGAYSGVGAIVLGALQDATTVTAADTALGYGLTALTNLTNQIGTVATVIGIPRESDADMSGSVPADAGHECAWRCYTESRSIIRATTAPVMGA